MPTKPGSWRDKGKGACWTKSNKSGATYVVCNDPPRGSKGQKDVYKVTKEKNEEKRYKESKEEEKKEKEKEERIAKSRARRKKEKEEKEKKEKEPKKKKAVMKKKGKFSDMSPERRKKFAKGIKEQKAKDKKENKEIREKIKVIEKRMANPDDYGYKSKVKDRKKRIAELKKSLN